MPIAIILAIAAAAAIGAGDFLGGIVLRRDPTASALVVTYVFSLVVSLPAAIAADGAPDVAGLGWGAAMGVMWVIGTYTIVRGIAEGQVVVVVPIAGVLSPVVPVTIDLVTGGWPSGLVAVGVIIGIMAVGLVGIGHGAGGKRSVRWSAVQGAIGGLATGGSLAAMERAADSGLWPLVAVGVVAAALMATLLKSAGALRRPPGDALLPGVAMGLLFAGSFVALMVAFPRGSLTVVSVITAQYPAATILLAALVWKQRPRGIQYAGVALTLVAVGLIAAGA